MDLQSVWESEIKATVTTEAGEDGGVDLGLATTVVQQGDEGADAKA